MTGCTVRTTNGNPMKTSATMTPSGVNATLTPSGASRLPIEPVRRVDRSQSDAGHRRRQRERQVDERIDDAAAGKPISHEHPRKQEAEDDIHGSSDERRAE